MNYEAYLKTSAWRKKSSVCLRAANYHCAICNGTENLQAHHRTYENIGNELPGDLTCLCDNCHRLYSKRLPEQPYSWLRRLGIAIEDVIYGRGDD